MKATYLFFLMMLITVSVHAQRMRFSISGNSKFCWFNSKSESINLKGAIVGLSPQLGLDYFFAGKYAISSGILVENSGGKLSYTDTISFKANNEQKLLPAGTVIKYRLQYLGVPIGLKLKTQEIGYSTFFVNFGLTPLFNIKSRVYNTGVFPDKANAKNEIRALNINYFFSSGIEYSLGGNTALIGGVRYSAGFMNISSRARDKLHTRSIGLHAGILF